MPVILTVTHLIVAVSLKQLQHCAHTVGAELNVTSASAGLAHGTTLAMALENDGGHVPLTQSTLCMMPWNGGALLASAKHELHCCTYSCWHVMPLMKL